MGALHHGYVYYTVRNTVNSQSGNTDLKVLPDWAGQQHTIPHCVQNFRTCKLHREDGQWVVRVLDMQAQGPEFRFPHLSLGNGDSDT